MWDNWLTENYTVHAAQPTSRDALRERLLDIGGASVVRIEHLAIERARLLADGTCLDAAETDLVEHPLDDSECHFNTARLWMYNHDHEDGGFDIMHGYGLGDPDTDPADAQWRCHSWIITADDTIIETTVPRLQYYGVRLTGAEARAFANGEHVWSQTDTDSDSNATATTTDTTQSTLFTHE